MRKEWILTDEEKYLKREKIVRNRMIKKQAQIGPDHSTTIDVIRSTEVKFFPQLTILNYFFYFLATFFFSTRTISY